MALSRAVSEPLLIVGGGIAGIVAALRAREDGRAVILVERQPNLGGLLASCRPGDGEHWFDHGTHLPAETGDAALDRRLFGGLDQADWSALPVLKAGTFWHGRLNQRSPWIDLRALPEADYREVLGELLRPAGYDAGSGTTLGDQLRVRYGALMVERIFDPTLRKFYGLRADALAPDAHCLFGLMRFVCLDAARTRELKRDPVLDAKLAYHSYEEKPSSAPRACAFYPRRGGVGQWIAGLESALRASGVEILTSCSVREVEPLGRTATLSNGRHVNYTELAWTLPAALLLRLLGHEAAKSLGAPRLSASTLYHFVADTVPETDAHYVTCHDPALRTFRATFYGNLQPETAGTQRITVEVLTPDASVSKPAAAEIFAELKRMTLMPEGAGYSRCHVQELGEAFPIQTPAYRRDTHLAAEIVEGGYEDIRLIGRAAGRSFFMKDVLLDAWRAGTHHRQSLPVA